MILRYLSEHSEARDTLEGIVQWWLLEENIQRTVREVREVVSSLVEESLLIEVRTKNSRPHYRLNPEKRNQVHRLLRKFQEVSDGCEDLRS